ncbi:hypothetical protein ALC57_10141 [Trachymyrmex cornetzi]|uniref:Uncharacterized protein n=1 Tax=Trachymyrmex cornetzi TaxID=471704 RepID=A0A151J4K2_9HYME|nr:hypothetical protein ALC57_10141 [Trachymyrmex cornetzi]
MYSVHVTPGRSTERKKNSADMDNEIRTYGRRRKKSISVKLVNYIRSQFQSDTMSVTNRRNNCACHSLVMQKRKSTLLHLAAIAQNNY